jgi:3-phosphoglycerate kinase
MFACSFLCCCCCSRIGRDALIICDFSKNWINSIQKTYEKKTSEEIKKIAREAISVLENTRKKIYDKGSIIKNKNYIDWMNNHNDTLYRIHDIYTDGWMHRIFNSLYNMAITTVQIDYSLSENDINKLFVAMPLFYPVIYQSEDYSFQMRENIVDTIQRMLT